MTNPAYEATNCDVEKLIAGCIIKSIHTGNSFTVEYVSHDGHCFVLEPREIEKSRVYDMHDFKRSFELVAAPNGMMQLSNELAEMKRKCAELQEQKDKWAAWAIALGAKADELESRPLCVKSDTPMREAAALCVKLPAAATDVLAERQRQITSEGWTPEHDDAYQNSELADAAACYAIHAHNQGFSTPAHWPWNPEWWKQSGPRRDMVKAGALIIAEIERIDRAACGTVEGGE